MHPVESLWSTLRRDVDPALPAHLAPVPHRISEPQFFPGASGLLPYENWSEVKPCSTGDRVFLPPVPDAPVILLGNFFATYEEFVEIDQGRLTHFGRTWDSIAAMFEGILQPNEVLLTNSYPALPKTGGREGSVRPDRAYKAACGRFLAEEVRVLRPRAVIAMGSPATQLLASICPDLEAWKGASFSAIDERGAAVVEASVGGVRFRAASISHPSARPVTRRGRRYGGLAGWEAERAVVAEAANGPAKS